MGTILKKMLFDFLPYIPGRISKKIYAKYIGHSEFEIRRNVYLVLCQDLVQVKMRFSSS